MCYHLDYQILFQFIGLYLFKMESKYYTSHHLKLFLLVLTIFIVLSMYWTSTHVKLTIYMNNKIQRFDNQWDNTITSSIQKNNPSSEKKENLVSFKQGITQSKYFLSRLETAMKTYLIPITKELHNRTAINDSSSEQMLRSGFGLQSYKTERNEEIWIENGVQYRPFPFLEKSDNPFYTSEFEAYVPFNKTLFFEGDDKKSLAEIKEKKIILWWQHKIAQAPINGLNPLRACPDFPCVLTSDRKYTENSSAILVNGRTLLSIYLCYLFLVKV